MSLSTAYIISAPMIIPKQQNHIEENLMLSGMSLRKDMASITPAANASMLYIMMWEGFLRTPISEPMIGAAMLMIRMI